jgi:hypothetical protein
VAKNPLRENARDFTKLPLFACIIRHAENFSCLLTQEIFAIPQAKYCSLWKPAIKGVPYGDLTARWR